MKRVGPALAACLTSVFTFGAPAFATVSIAPTSVAAGSTTDVGFAITSEAGERATTRVRVEVEASAGVTQADTAFLPGWSSTIDRNADDTFRSVTWDQGRLAAGATQTFVLTMLVPTTQSALNFTVRQSYSDGTVVTYPATGESLGLTVTGAAPATTAAASTTTTAAAPGAAAAERSTTASTIGRYLIIFGVVVILALYFRTKNAARRQR